MKTFTVQPQTLRTVPIPEDTIVLKFDDSFNRDIPVGIIPMGVRRVILGTGFKGSIEKGALPSSVISVVLTGEYDDGLDSEETRKLNLTKHVVEFVNLKSNKLALTFVFGMDIRKSSMTLWSIPPKKYPENVKRDIISQSGPILINLTVQGALFRQHVSTDYDPVNDASWNQYHYTLPEWTPELIDLDTGAYKIAPKIISEEKMDVPMNAYESEQMNGDQETQERLMRVLTFAMSHQ